MPKVVRYAVSAGFLMILAFTVGWPLLDDAGRRALVLATGVAFVVQAVSFSVRVAVRPGTAGYLAAWVGSTLVRLGVVGGAAFVFASMKGVDLVVALLALVGFLFVLLLLEPWALREPRNGGTNG